VGIALIVPFSIAALLLPIPPEIKVALSITPLIIPGYYATKTEELIKKREMFYPAFIRSLGTSTAGTGKETTFALKKLRFYKFGPLTDNINDLYKRLALRIDKRLAWKTFGSETGSDLISKFNDLYVDGTEVGGNAKKISRIISENFLRMLSLRKKRFLAASTTSGILYGSMIFIAFPLYILIWVISIMNNMFAEIAPISQEYSFLGMFSGAMISLQTLRIIMFSLVMAHVVVATAIKKVVSASSNVKVLYDAVIMTWVGAVTSVITYTAVNHIIL
jgi:flagellar protein FlaJ